MNRRPLAVTPALGRRPATRELFWQEVALGGGGGGVSLFIFPSLAPLEVSRFVPRTHTSPHLCPLRRRSSLGAVGRRRSLPAQMAPPAPPSLNYSINYCGENVQLKWTVIMGHVAPYLIGLHLIPGLRIISLFFFTLRRLSAFAAACAC